MKTLLLLLLLFLVNGCGYKPSSYYTKKVVGEKISTSVVILAQDPENTVIIKDAVDRAIIELFHASLTSKRYATTHLHFSISAPNYVPIQYNTDGFVVTYRATIVLSIIKEHNGLRKKYRAKGSYDFGIVPNAVITDQERFDAIRYSAQKAISSFIAQVSAEGSRK